MDTNPPVVNPPGAPAAPVFDPARAEAEKRLLSGANWFFWIAGLSVVNSILGAVGAGTYFVVGLGVTLFIDGIAMFVREDYGGDAGLIATLVVLVINVLIVGVVALFGVFARRRMGWPFYVGIPLYLLDGLLMLVFGDFLGAIFHAVALYSLIRGAQAVGKLKKLDAASPGSGLWQP